jgi:hypothetical protein
VDPKKYILYKSVIPGILVISIPKHLSGSSKECLGINIQNKDKSGPNVQQAMPAFKTLLYMDKTK